MNFRDIVPEDQALLNEYIKDIDNYQTDFSIATILLFQEFQKPEICIDEKSIFIKGFFSGEETFFSPLCKLEDFNESMEKIITYFKEKDKPYKILYIQEEYIKEFLKYKNIDFGQNKENFYEKYGKIKSNEFVVYNDRNDAEYIYLPSNLINLEGNKYRKIREKIRSFKKEFKNNYEIVEYCQNDFKSLLNLLDSWNKEKNSDSVTEIKRMKFVLENKEKLDLKIYLLKINNNLAGMTIMQILPNNVGVIIFEKSFSKYKNANCILNLFEANHLKNCKVISRQEDMGIEGLRQAKLSFRPCCLEKKFNIYQFNEKEYFHLYKSIFGDSDKLINLVKNSPNFNLKHSSFVLKRQNIISIGSTREKKLRIFNQIENVPFIFGIATKKQERRKGYASEVLKKMLRKINFDKYNIAMIAPEEEYLVNYYQKFGFIKFNFTKPIPIENLFKRNFDIRLGNIEDSEEITNLFKIYGNKYKISQYRDIHFTKERLKEVFVDDGKLFILSSKGKNYGYFIYEQGYITEYINISQDEENENIDIVKNILVNKNIEYILECETINAFITSCENNIENSLTYSLIRIINPQEFVKKYLEYIDFNDSEKEENFNKNFIVKDEIFEDCVFNIKRVNNKIIFSLNIDNNAINILISISELTNIIFRNFKNYDKSCYAIKDIFYFTEKW